MFEILRTRIQQKYRTLSYPDGPVPTLSDRFQGRPSLPIEACPQDCQVCVTVCPHTGHYCNRRAGGRAAWISTWDVACSVGPVSRFCPTGALQFSGDHQLAASDRQSLQIGCSTDPCSVADDRIIRRLFGRSLRLRQVSAGGCNACEADANVLTTLAWDLGRFGIDFVASPPSRRRPARYRPGDREYAGGLTQDLRCRTRSQGRDCGWNLCHKRWHFCRSSRMCTTV